MVLAVIDQSKSSDHLGREQWVFRNLVRMPPKVGNTLRKPLQVVCTRPLGRRKYTLCHFCWKIVQNNWYVQGSWTFLQHMSHLQKQATQPLVYSKVHHSICNIMNNTFSSISSKCFVQIPLNSPLKLSSVASIKVYQVSFRSVTL